MKSLVISLESQQTGIFLGLYFANEYFAKERYDILLISMNDQQMREIHVK